MKCMIATNVNIIVHVGPDPGEAEEVRSPALRGRMQGPVEVMFTRSDVRPTRPPHAP